MSSVGTWKSFQEVEDNLSLDELFLIIEQLNEKERRDMEWQAAMQGVDLKKESGATETSAGAQAIFDGVVAYEKE